MFKTLYTHLRYKITPPSFNAKNRLFIERDSVKRKIMNNLGLTFRNGKWTDYARHNTNLNFRAYWKGFFWTILVVLILFFWTYHVPPLTLVKMLPSWIGYSIWVISDYFDYVSLFIVWLSFAVWDLIRRAIFRLIFNNINVKDPIRPQDDGYQKYLEYQAEVEDMKDSLRVTKKTSSSLWQGWESFCNQWVERAQLQTPYLSETRLDFTLHRLFYLNYILDLFKPSPRITLSNSPLAYSQSTLINEKIFKLASNRTSPQIADSSTLSDKWTAPFLHPLNLDFERSSKMVRNELSWESHLKSSNMFLNIPSIGSLWSDSISLRLADRWLKKYSMLHRHSISHMSLISQVKRNLRQNTFNVSSRDWNLWSSETWSSATSEHLLKQLNARNGSFNYWDFSNNSLSYQNFGSTISYLYNYPLTNSLSYLETSAFFSLHRLFYFTTLESNRRRVIVDARSQDNSSDYNLSIPVDAFYALSPLLSIAQWSHQKVNKEGNINDFENIEGNLKALSLFGDIFGSQISLEKGNFLNQSYPTSEKVIYSFFDSHNLYLILDIYRLGYTPVIFPNSLNLLPYNDTIGEFKPFIKKWDL